MITAKKDHYNIFFTAVAVILSAVYISLIWNNNVWMDEAFTASLVYTDLPHVIERSMADTLPPLYNIVLWLMTSVFGYSIPVMKMTSVIPMILTLAAGATIVRKRFGKRTALLFMMCTTFMPLMLYFGVEIRMYSLGFLFATLSGIYAYEVSLEASRKNAAFFCIFSALAGYSHHFAFVTVGFTWLYLLLHFVIFRRDKLKVWFFCLLAVFVMYLPCLIVTIGQFSRVSGYFSMPDIDLHTFVQYAVYPYTVGMTPASVCCLVLMLAAICLFIRNIIKGRYRDEKGLFAASCFCTYYGVLIFGKVICTLMSANIFVDRYLFFSVGLLWLFASICLSGNDKIFYPALCACIFIGVCSYMVQFETEYGNSAGEEMAFLRENIAEGDIYYSIGGHEEMENCIPFYTYLDDETPDLTFVYPLEEAVTESRRKGVTLWISVLDGYEPSEEDLRVLKDNSLSLKKAAEFDFDRYSCEFYRAGP